MATNTGLPKNRILVLHGFYDSAQNRRLQMRSLIRAMKDIEFVFIDSPFSFVDYGFVKSTDTPLNEQRYQWMSYKPEWSLSDYNYDTIKESVAYVVDYIKQNGPFDGLLGFSQGAIVCAAMTLLISDWPRVPDCIKYVILVGCLPINDEKVKPVLATVREQNLLPTLHVSGVTDRLVTPEMSRSLFEHFNPSSVQFYQHKGGHYCPSDSDFRQKLREFIDRATNAKT